jgi:hypothetical protein
MVRGLLRFCVGLGSGQMREHRLGPFGRAALHAPQSPMAEEPAEFRTGGNLEICSGAGLEAIWFGIFGLQPHDDGSIRISPAPFNPKIGKATLAGLFLSFIIRAPERRHLFEDYVDQVEPQRT